MTAPVRAVFTRGHDTFQTDPMTTKTHSGIAYEYTPATGTRPILLFLHAGVADRRMWDDQVAALGPRYGLVRMDLRGFGDSEDDSPGWTPTHDVVEVLDTIGVHAVHVVAASYGSGVATQVAIAHPHRVLSMVLAPVGGAMLLTMTPALRAFIDTERAALAVDDLDAAVEANIDAWVVGVGRTEREVPAGVCDRVRVMQRRAFELDPGISAPADDDDETFDDASQVTVPTLIIVGAHDLDASLDSSSRWATALPSADLEHWDDVAHLPSLEQPHRFNERLDRWLADHGA